MGENSPKPTKDELDQVILIWSEVVRVQMHFNDIEMRIRALFVTVMVAIVGAAGFALQADMTFGIFGANAQLGLLLLPVGAIASRLFLFVDKDWYHRLLVGSVKHAIQIENKYSGHIPDLSLSDAIGKESPVKVPKGFWLALAKLFVSDRRLHSDGELHSDAKIEVFYKSVFWALITVSILWAVVGGVTVDGNNLFTVVVRAAISLFHSEGS